MNPRSKLPHPAPIRILMVEDDPGDAQRMRELIEAAEGGAVDIAHAQGVEAGLRTLRDEEFDVVLLDLSLEEGQGLDSLGRARVAAATVPIIVMADQVDENLALRALRFGAQDYLVKGDSDERLVSRTIHYAVERHRILTDLAVARQREHYLANHDALTALPNRGAFLDHLRRGLAHAARYDKQLAVLFLDIDRFKGINDTLGHPVGDQLLKVVAERLARALRRTDSVARLGGDEFLIMIQDVKRDYDPARVAEKLVGALGKPCALDGREYRISASVGIAVYPRDGIDAHVLIRNADTAMYQAKADQVSGYSYYTEGMNEIVAQRLDLERRLREAIEARSFVLHYQPVVDVDLGAVVGAEALLRWREPGGGLISPASFVPVAEETGLIAHIGRWALRQACEDVVGWTPSAPIPPRISVNVSSRQLLDPSFPDFVTRTLRDTGLEPNRLELEITESSVLHERGTTLAALQVLRRLRVRVTIDDFGTGYSALTALKYLPVDGLKIDRSFVGDVANDPATATIATGLLTMAAGLGIMATAEGVATPEQLRFLYDRGCRQMQGYLFGKPMPSSEFAAHLKDDSGPWNEALSWVPD
jgi:diguanylate cyclase (GGDEF)-like protein